MFPLHVEGSMRNSVVTSFREWRGNQYVPSAVHSSVRWSMHNPWIENEVLNLEDCLAFLEKTREKKNDLKHKHVGKPDKPTTKDIAELGIGMLNTQKRQRSSELPCLLSATSTHPSNKQRSFLFLEVCRTEDITLPQ